MLLQPVLFLPRKSQVVQALVWELVWKNRVVVPALGAFLAIGFGLSQAVLHADPMAWWANYARGIGFITFLASILLTFAPFTLMDNHGSWRMIRSRADDRFCLSARFGWS